MSRLPSCTNTNSAQSSPCREDVVTKNKSKKICLHLNKHKNMLHVFGHTSRLASSTNTNNTQPSPRGVHSIVEKCGRGGVFGSWCRGAHRLVCLSFHLLFQCNVFFHLTWHNILCHVSRPPSQHRVHSIVNKWGIYTYIHIYNIYIILDVRVLRE